MFIGRRGEGPALALALSRARARAKSDQHQPVDIPRFPFRKQGKNRTVQAERSQFQASAKFAAVSAMGMQMRSRFVPFKA
jgi:hypothetical protein